MQEAHYSMWLPIFPTYVQMVIAEVAQTQYVCVG
jgi:hypothetical protein